MTSLDYLLKWKPTRITRLHIEDGMDRKKAFKVFRGSSTGFANKREVKKAVYSRCSSKCVYCRSTDNLQVDHIESVYSCFNSGQFDFCNTLDNLQLLCFKCNNKKS